MKPIERISEYLKYKVIAQHQFEQSLHLSNGYIYKQLKNKGSVGSDILIRIHEKYTELNILWILTGEGHMLNSFPKLIEIN